MNKSLVLFITLLLSTPSVYAFGACPTISDIRQIGSTIQSGYPDSSDPTHYVFTTQGYAANGGSLWMLTFKEFISDTSNPIQSALHDIAVVDMTPPMEIDISHRSFCNYTPPGASYSIEAKACTENGCM